MSAVGTVAVNLLSEFITVTSAEAFQSTEAPLAKPVPFTVSAKPFTRRGGTWS